MDALLLIADNDVRRRGELRRFFSDNGFLVMAAASGRECQATLESLEPDVLVIAMEIPGGAEGAIARANDSRPAGKKPIVLVLGHAPAEMLSLRTRVACCNCFSEPVRKEDLRDRIGMEFAGRLLPGIEEGASRRFAAAG